MATSLYEDGEKSGEFNERKRFIRNMRSEGFDEEVISKVSGLSLDELKKFI